ncbi:metallophosphoesterase [Microbulbifer elongatus]|uniref:Metallophosphoesterase n=1 Tax=Microbulbifer elongatus TaxID=86173 RepID=A0ABT1NXK1_9GAMM|nr:DUF4382 domain-containing protein [Microbulbifer elongatus]MCQ3828605.1 metallophosphoesterase [Microbulbifer elongatus]
MWKISLPPVRHWLFQRSAAFALSTLLTACGGGAGGNAPAGEQNNAPPPPSNAQCETSDNGSDSEQCGALFVGITDADGDFLQYQVAVVSLSLERADGAVVEVLPSANTVDFAQYVDVTELVTAATVPVGTYIGGEITLDYREADVRVEVAGEARAATVVDDGGAQVEQITLALTIDNRNQLVIAPGIPAMLTADFDLAASHTVDVSGAEPAVTLYPVLVAEVNAHEHKDFRIRGPLITVAEKENDYRIAVRPFYRSQGRFGGVDIETDSETTWEINGEAYVGAAGLAALAELEAGTATLAMGVYEGGSRVFRARAVLVGASVPGAELDAVEGHVVARSDNLLTVRGATLVRTDGALAFNQQVTVQLADTTVVRKPLKPFELLTTDDISIGQRIRILGEWENERGSLQAQSGRAHLLLTRLSATGGERVSDTLQVAALAFGGRDISLFDFSGTGDVPENDASPTAYQVSAAGLHLGAIDPGAPLSIRGYVAPYASAPVDFNALSVADFSDARARMLLSWQGEGDTGAFVSLDGAGLTLSADGAIGAAHHIRRGAHHTDLFTLDALPSIAPADAQRFSCGIYTLAVPGDDSRELLFFSDFGSFATELGDRLAGGAAVKLLHASGYFDDGDNRFSAIGLSVVLRRPTN